jgi:aminoglycoside phosphotransferase
LSLEACLPAELRGPTTSITRVAAGLSGAGVYRVQAGGRAFVLKIAADAEPVAAWRCKLEIQQLAATAGLAPAVIHTDEARRAVVSAFVVDRSFPAFYADPRTRGAALTQLGQTVRRVHDLPLPSQAPHVTDPRDFLASIGPALPPSFALPAFVSQAVQRVLAETAPPSGRAPVLSHNDVNPTNLIYDGENLLLLDWDTAGVNDPFYDLGSIAVFLRMDEATCLDLLTAYEAKPVSALPARFAYSRRLVAALCGSLFLRLASESGHAGASGAETLEAAPSLGDVYQQARSGALSLASAEGQWRFGLALLKTSLEL